ncbi:tetratricopeptide repeat protein [Chitinispirillales bacterium ANBcel5]|uniref:tetratricopeptide repeat protein n=1 Tax=Cellulosispirillum alkaliphilum TaxID=3039283 RepID=UPI002A597F43|nr:tetratricopeptide repeat protein [Chitinispirillales bacterium ANBcel5]
MSNTLYPDRKNLEKHYKKMFPTYSSVLEDFQRNIKDNLKELDVHLTVKYRVKAFESYYKKLLSRMVDEKRTGELIPIQDIIGIRIVCPFLENLQEIVDVLNNRYTLEEVERKGAQHTFKEFGYNSIHLLIQIPAHITERYPQLESGICEIQIRTFLQDAWAEVEHELIYKAHITPLDEPLRRKLAALNANLTLSDIIFQEIRDYQRQLHTELEKRRYSFLCQLEGQKPGLAPLVQKECKEKELKAEPVLSGNKDQLLLEALFAHNRKDFASAIAIYSRILDHQIDPPLKAIVLVHRGMAYFSESKYTSALNDFRAATKCEPTNSRAFYHLGIANRIQNKNAEAIDSLKTSIDLNPYDFRALLALAMTYYEVGDYVAALEHCDKALRIDPQSKQGNDFKSLVISKMNM